MSSGSYERVTYEEETSWRGSGTGSVREIPHTGIQMARSSQFFDSRIVRSDRQTQDIVRGFFSAGGTCPYELLYAKRTSTTTNAFDDWIKWALLSDADWTTPQSDVTGATATATTVSKTGAFASGWAVGDWIRVTVGSAAPSYQLITDIDGPGDQITVSPGGLTSGSANTTVEHGSYVKNGRTEKSFKLTRSFLDLPDTGSPDQAVLYEGTEINGWSLNVEVSGPVSGTWTLVSYDEEPLGSIASPSAGYAASSYRVFDSVADVKLFAAGQPLAAFTGTSFGFELNNGIEPRREIGVEGASSMRIGSLSASASATRYFSDNDELQDYIDNNESAIATALQDSLGNAFVLWLPSVVVENAARVGGGKDNDIEVQIRYRAKLSSTYGETVRITRFDA